LKQLRFFIPAILFFLFAFSADRKIVNAGPVYSHADTARIDSIANRIEDVLADHKGECVITKTFACENSADSGNLSAFYQGKKLVLIEVRRCGSDHGSSEFTAAFINEKLACYTGADYVWSFEEQRATDSVCCPTFDETNSFIAYFHNERQIKSTSTFEKIHHAWNETEASSETTYYFDDSGPPVNLEEIQMWIEFANSKKSYADFFKN
jgi:hypothetical protein